MARRNIIVLRDERSNAESSILPGRIMQSEWYQGLVRRAARCFPLLTVIPVTVLYVDAARIRSLNKRYRHSDRVTDVLAFDYHSLKGTLEEGEIVICLTQALRQRHCYKTTITQECARLFFHGLLHIHGFDHKTTSQRKCMRALELCCKKAVRV